MKKKTKIRYRKKPAEQRRIAKERINELFRQADKRMSRKRITSADKALANRYVSLARKISMKYKVKIPTKLKRRFCRHCYRFLKPGTNCRVRLAKGRVIYYCLECKRFMRFAYKSKRAKKP